MGLLTILTDPGNFKFYDSGDLGSVSKYNSNDVSKKNAFGQKNIPFGKDKLGGGSSNQPFIQSKIGEPLESGILDSDSIIRGGLTAPLHAAVDVVRLTKYMVTPSGLEFIAKQNILSRVAVRTQASGILNEGIYNPLSTLAQVGVGFLGQHLPKQGLIPGVGVQSYTNAVTKNIFEENRLIELFNKHYSPPLSNSKFSKFLKKLSPGEDIYKYSGGPGSVLGVGNTHIRYATDNGGISALKTLGWDKPKEYQTRRDIKSTWETGKLDSQELTLSFFKSPILKKLHEFGRHLITFPEYQNDTHHFEPLSTTSFKINLGRYSSNDSLTVHPGSIGGQTSTGDAFDNGTTDWEKSVTLNKATGYLGNLNKNAGPYGVGEDITTDNPYRVGGRGISYDFRYTDRKKRGFVETEDGDFDNSYDYILPLDKNGGKDYEGYFTDKIDKIPTIDKIYYNHKKDAKGNPNVKRLSNVLDEENDYIPFNISIIDPTNPTGALKTLKFRAYIDSFSDSYDSNWKGQTYMGRAEQFWKYNQFSRDINFGFTIVADNSVNHATMYGQLNTLVSSLAPTYTLQGYMAGNLHKITLGNYITETTGILHGMTLEIPDDSPWGTREMYQTPHYIKVTGIKFTPIHNFRPEYKSIRTNNFIDFSD